MERCGAKRPVADHRGVWGVEVGGSGVKVTHRWTTAHQHHHNLYFFNEPALGHPLAQRAGRHQGRAARSQIVSDIVVR